MTCDERAELAALRKMNRRLREDVEILKRAAFFVSRRPGERLPDPEDRSRPLLVQTTVDRIHHPHPHRFLLRRRKAAHVRPQFTSHSYTTNQTALSDRSVMRGLYLKKRLCAVVNFQRKICNPDEFCDALAAALNAKNLDQVPAVTCEPPVELHRVVIGDPYFLTDSEKRNIAGGFAGRFAAVGFQCDANVPILGARHPLIALGKQLSDVLPCTRQMHFAVEADDGTGKVVDSGHATVLARSNRAMPGHQDGPSSGARANVVGLWADSSAAVNPRTFTQNLLRVAVDLRNADESAFNTLFAADAITITRKADGISLVSPVLFLDDNKSPRIFFRAPGSEYEVASAASSEAQRAFTYLVSYSEIDSPGSAWIELSPPGSGLLFNNHVNIHGRTSFQNGRYAGKTRVLAIAAWVDSVDAVNDTIGRVDQYRR